MRVVVVQMVALLSLVRAVVRVAVHGAVKALTVQVVVLQRACVGVRGGHSGSDGANSASGAAVGGGSATEALQEVAVLVAMQISVAALAVVTMCVAPVVVFEVTVLLV